MAKAIRWLMLTVFLLLIGFVPIPRDRLYRWMGFETSTEVVQITVGSKKFTESVILGEIVRIISEDSGVPTAHVREVGGTQLLFEAARKGEIDLYPEYTGTLKEEILKAQNPQNDDEMRSLLERQGIRVSRPIGFQNNYAIGMLRTRAEELGIERISDLVNHPNLKFGFSNEFMERGDAWPGLKQSYRLPQQDVFGLDHDLAYRQLEYHEIDAIDIYTTDAKIRIHDIKPLVDDLGYFPRYDAVLLYRADLAERFPNVMERLKQLEDAIDEPQMIALNELADSKQKNETEIAGQFLQDNFSIIYDASQARTTRLERLTRTTVDHLDLVRRSLIPAILVAVPLGIIAANYAWLGQIVLGVTGIVQTIPAFALLALLLPVTSFLGLHSIGPGSATAVIALFLYSLLPVVRNTYSGLHDIDPSYRESAIALGLNRMSRLVDIEIPLAMRSILSGIKTAAVINIGFATLGAIIGAGGYGQPILTGIRLYDNSLILEGAIPAAAMAIVVQFGFELLERKIVSPGLRLKRI